VLRGLENLDKFAQAHSVWDLLRAARHLDIHAPVSDIANIAGLLLAGGAVWGPYALNVISLCVAIYALSTTAALKDPIVFTAGILLLLLQPITFSALAELKSDWQGGVLLAAAMFVLFDAAEENSKRGRVLGSILLGLMLITKTTAFYMPVLALGVFTAFELYGALKNKILSKNEANNLSRIANDAIARTGPSLRLRVICVAVILIPYLLFFFYSYRDILTYIRGALGPLWTDGLTVSERLLYYAGGSPWHDYSPVLAKGAPRGAPYLILLPFLGAAVIAALLKRAWLHLLACVGILAISTVFLTPLVLARTSVISFGAPFFGTMIGGALIFMRIFVANTPRWGALIAPIAVLVLALPSPLPLSPPRDSNGTPLGRPELESYRSIYDNMVEKISRADTLKQPKVVFTFEQFVMPYPNLSIRYFRRTGHFPSVYRLDNLADHEADSLLADADFVVTITPIGGARSVPNVGGNIPTSIDPASSDARIRENGHYGLIASYPVRGGEIRLYEAGAPQ
jgi:hypothetical protein